MGFRYGMPDKMIPLGDAIQVYLSKLGQRHDIEIGGPG
jgi:hypothetical protein